MVKGAVRGKSEAATLQGDDGLPVTTLMPSR